MIRRPTMRRPGLSLMEVLVGFGILGIGVTSVIVLFPFSAITIGHALQHDRATTCAITADGYLRDYHTHNVVEWEQAGNVSGEPYHQRMDNPGAGLPPPRPGEPSYPVALDPMGYVARAGRTDQSWIGDPLTGTPLTGVARCPLAITDPARVPTATAQALSLRLCSQMDGLSYTEDGTVDSTKLPAGIAEMRELRYNWMWVLQRPVNRDRYTVRMQVVVFDKRAHLYAPPKSEAVFAPSAGFAGVLFTPGETAITNVPNTAELRKGSWVMDATIANTVDRDGVTRPLRHAEFYRVLSVTEVGNTYSLEVHKPVARPDGLIYPPDTTFYAYRGTLVSMPAAVDVFDRPVMTAGTGP